MYLQAEVELEAHVLWKASTHELLSTSFPQNMDRLLVHSVELDPENLQNCFACLVLLMAPPRVFFFLRINIITTFRQPAAEPPEPPPEREKLFDAKNSKKQKHSILRCTLLKDDILSWQPKSLFYVSIVYIYIYIYIMYDLPPLQFLLPFYTCSIFCSTILVNYIIEGQICLTH